MRFLALIAGVFVAMVGAIVGGVALPAAAHGGPLQLTVAHDGLGGVFVAVSYVGDGDPVEEVVDAVMTATSPSGKSVGPIYLVSAPQGIGVWETAEPVLENGHWTVTVAITTPSEASATIEVDVVPPEAPLEGSVVDPESALRAATGAPNVPWGSWLVPLVVLGVSGGVAVLIALRRSRASIGRSGL